MDPEDGERRRAVRERLEATVSGLRELVYLRQRQELLVRAALDLGQEEEEEEEEEEQRRRRRTRLNSKEKLLEENILLLRTQLRDGGLISQLQELDRQISDLRLDPEASHDQPETDSRPSSGFYELSDAASGSLSNSSNSIFSECFCSMADADGRIPPAGELASCLDCGGLVGGLGDDSAPSATVRRSLSAPHPAAVDPVPSVASWDAQSKFHSDLVARSGTDMFRYPSPLHAVAVQSPVFRHMLGPCRAEGPPPVPQSSSWPAPSSSSQNPSHKQLDSYIFSLVQRRAPPLRTSRPRTSISTDPSKSLLRQVGLCVRKRSGSGSEIKPSWPAGGAETAGTWSPQRQWSVEGRPENQEEVLPDGGVDARMTPNRSHRPNGVQTRSSLCDKKRPLHPSTGSTLPQVQLGLPRSNSSPKETQQPSLDQEVLLKPGPAVKTQSAAPKKSPKPPQPGPAQRAPECRGPDGGGGGRSHVVPAQRQSVKLCEGGSRMRTSRTSEHEPERRGEKSRRRSSSKRSRVLDDGGQVHLKISKRAGAHGTAPSGIKRPEGRVLDRHVTSLCAKPKYRRTAYRRLRAVMEVPHAEALRPARRRQGKQPGAPLSWPERPYATGSDSEYSAECASLFHSTIVDISEDERSSYTANRFGDSECSKEDVEESAATSDTEESGGGRRRSQGGPAGQEVTRGKAFIKIKASHNLKKKILRFRSGSLKLMTTV